MDSPLATGGNDDGWKTVKRARPLLGTFVTIDLQGPAVDSSLNAWITAGFEAVEEVDRLMSRHRSDSDLTRLNQAKPGEWVNVNPLTAQVLKTSNVLFRVSEGAFDIRCRAAPSGSQPPLDINGSRVRKTGEWTFDLGGIAKGFAVDRAVKRIQHLTMGYPVSGTVNAGGDMRVWGPGAVPIGAQVRGQGTFWLRPFVIRETATATSSVRTSSDNTLTPAVHRLMPSAIPLEKEQTVTVLANQCLWADALTKVVMLASERIALACLESYHAKALIWGPGGHLQKSIG